MNTHSYIRLFIVCLSLFLQFTSTAAAQDHVRVVLDTSASMKKNDLGRNAVLATTLLFDLALPELNSDDSFAIIPFHPTEKWHNSKSLAPHHKVGSILNVKNRKSMIQALSKVKYNGNWTLFYPGLFHAIKQLERMGDKEYARRVIVVVTDGVSEKPEELQYIERELWPRLVRENISLYILGIGKDATSQDAQKFFDRLVGAHGVFIKDPGGKQIIQSMIKIFCGSFGYTRDLAPEGPANHWKLDLAKRQSPYRVAVVAHRVLAKATPKLKFRPPPKGIIKSPVQQRHAVVQGGSYSLQWLSEPNDGIHTMTTGGRPTVAILRPTQLNLSFAKKVYKTLSGRPTPMVVQVNSGTRRGRPGPGALSFRSAGEKDRAGRYKWGPNRWVSAIGGGLLRQNSRKYKIRPEWPYPPDKENLDSFYMGNLEIKLQQRNTVVGRLSHIIAVYPNLELLPAPKENGLVRSGVTIGGRRNLKSRERGCTDFKYQLVLGDLPHRHKDEYDIEAFIKVQKKYEPQLSGVQCDLDGLVVGPKTHRHKGPWAKGRILTREMLLEESHQVCCQLGRVRNGGKAEIVLQSNFQEVPYSEFKVIKPFSVKIIVEGPVFVERWAGWFAGSVLLLCLLVALWYLRPRPDFPADFCYKIGQSPDTSVWVSVHSEFSLKKYFGLSWSAPVRAGPKGRIIARLKPLSVELYHLELGANTVMEDPKYPNTFSTPSEIEVRRTYIIRNKNDLFYFSVGYR